ncbi:hypothetical protein [Streptomyces sp. ISL-100]|uniref:hypothetical protein n=1 Tax=Streptomyces sp. ISL-100 TaxID=2819173 RepID=UPI001BEC7BA4|nr:hypothetical protein [Streptomyces sp. ISL-100]MBT2398610.1 hypothetical protein [Streptomyces sp. ISL-100]
MKLTILVTLLVTVVAVAVVTMNSSSQKGDSGVGENAPNPSRNGIDLERRINAFATEMVADSGYRPPSRVERRTVAEGVGLLVDGRRAEAGRKLAEVDFGVRTLTDRATGRRYAEVADAAGEANRGWGRVYVGLGAPVRWSVQVPHPVADADSERLGSAVLTGQPGGVLVVAGAHRRAGRGDAADVAHRRDTVFHAVCDELTERRLPGVQLHGFADSTEPDYDVIVSTGRDRSTEARESGRRLARALGGRDFEVCRAWARTCVLEGRENKQGRAAAELDVPFLHVEFSHSVRSDAARAGRAVAAVRSAVAAWT